METVRIRKNRRSANEYIGGPQVVIRRNTDNEGSRGGGAQIWRSRSRRIE